MHYYIQIELKHNSVHRAVHSFIFQPITAEFVFHFSPSLVKSDLISLNKNTRTLLGDAPCAHMDAAYCSHIPLLTDKVIITCTQLPLPSRWSRSPDSCPCSLPAPGRNQKSPYKCSHTSRLHLSLLTPSGAGILQNRHRVAHLTRFYYKLL